MAVTLQDIADAAGVHVMTVSRALRGQGRMTDETRRRITELAERLGYRAHEGARSVRSGRFNRVLLVRSVDLKNRSWTPPGLVDLLESQLAEHGLDLSLARVRDEELTGAAGPAFLARRMADGLVINYGAGASDELGRQVETAGVPAVWVNTRGQGCCIHPDDAGMCRATVDHLAGLGHRRIALVAVRHYGMGGREHHYSVQERHDAYLAAMTAAGLEARVELHPTPEDQAIPRAAALLRALQADGITACIGVNGSAAYYFPLAAARAGIAIPDELSLAVPLWPEETGAMMLQVDGYRIDDRALVARAVELLRRRIERPDAGEGDHAIPGHPSWGTTTAPPPTRA